MQQSKLKLITIGPLILFFILLIAFGTLLAISVQTSNTNLQNAVSEVSRPVTNTSAKLLFNPVYTLNITAAHDVINQFVDEETIVYAAVYDASGLRLTDETAGVWIPDANLIQTLSLSSINTNSTQEQEVEQYLLIAEPIAVGSEVIGTVVYAFDQGVLQAGLARAQTILTLSILIALIITSALVYVFMRNALAPLSHLSEVAQQIGSGRLSTQVNVEGYQEVASLATALDTMRSTLQASYSNLEQRVIDRTKALSTSTEVSRRLSTILDEKQLISEVVNQVQGAFDYYHVHIYLMDSKQEKLIIAGGTGEAGKIMLNQGHAITVGKGLVGKAGESNSPVLVSNTTNDPDWLPNALLPDTKSEIAVPISVGTDVLGVLDVQQNTIYGLKREDVDLLQSIANQAAIALQNSRTLVSVQERANREQLITSINQKILSENSVESALQVAVREIGRALGTRTQIKLKTPNSEN